MIIIQNIAILQQKLAVSTYKSMQVIYFLDSKNRKKNNFLIAIHRIRWLNYL